MADIPPVRPFIGDQSRIAGAFDYVDPSSGLRGWVVHSRIEALPIHVEAHCNGLILARSTAVLDRPDIDKVLKRQTYCGFLLGWSRFDISLLTRLANDDPEAELKVMLAGAEMEVPAVNARVSARDALKMLLGARRGDLRAEFATLNAYLEIEESGLFDPFWYHRQYGPDTETLRPPILHYLRGGEAMGLRPNLYFDPLEYARDASLGPDESRLLHYLRRAHGTRKPPTVHFDNEFYRSQYRLEGSVSALADYLERRPTNFPNSHVTAKHLKEHAGSAETIDAYEAFLRRAVRLEPAARSKLIGKSAGLAAILADAEALFAETSRELPAEVPEEEAQLASALKLLDGVSTFDDLRRALTSNPKAKDLAAQDGLPPTAAAVSALFNAASLSEQKQYVAAAKILAELLPDLSDAAKSPLQATAISTFLNSLLKWVHANWRPDQAAGMVGLLQALRKAKTYDLLSVQRILEVMVDSRDVLGSATAAEDMRRLFPSALKGWVLITLARFHMLQGDTVEAREMLSRVPYPPQSDDHLFAVSISLLIEAGDFESAASRLEVVKDSPNRDIRVARLRLAVRAEDFGAVVAALKHGDPSVVPNWVVCEAVYLTVKPGQIPDKIQMEAEELLLAALEPRVPEFEECLLAQLHMLIQRRRFDHLAALFTRIASLPMADAINIKIRELEYLCLSERTDEALALYRSKLADIKFGRWEGMSVIRLLSETKQWDEAGRLVLDHIRQGFGFASATHIAMRVVRKAGLHGAIAEMVSGGTISSSRDTELGKFLALVQEDHMLVQSARALSGQGSVPIQSLTRLSTNWMMSAAIPLETESTCLFLCTNRKYFLSLLTFLCSFFGQSQQSTALIYVFLDKDVPKSWHASITLVAARFNRSVEVVLEGEFMPAGVEHKAAYGFFAGGSGLSRAAYFRLYAARYLMALGRFIRALYVDTDIVCRGDLSELIGLDLDGKPLSARIEDYSQEVKHAAEINGLDPYRYFNSGVLVFDFAHSGLASALEQAIHLSETEADRLIFHDQCALNIAFARNFEPLPAAYNFYLRPHRDRNGYIEDGVLLHYLDKPKPWDIVFSRNYREEWRVWAVQLGMILPQTQYVDIFAAANEE